MQILSAERTVEVLLRLVDAPPVRPVDCPEIRPTEVRLFYAGSGYVRVEVRGKRTNRVGSDAGYWSHIEGKPSDPGNLRDTSHAPDFLRELAERFAPADFTPAPPEPPAAGGK